MAVNTFERIEKKYLLTEKQYQLVQDKLLPYMSLDEYGLHTISNIYYDTEHYDLIRTSLEKPKYKEKIRLRSYGTPNPCDNVFLELKKKYKGIVYKRRICLTLKEAEDYLEEGILPTMDSQILRELDYALRLYKPIAKMFIAYDRLAYYGNVDCDLRLTLDKNIRSRCHKLSLGSGSSGIHYFEDAYYVMEIKIPTAMPLWLVQILNENQIYPTSFSKYGSIYQKSLIKERRESQCLQVS